MSFIAFVLLSLSIAGLVVITTVVGSFAIGWLSRCAEFCWRAGYNYCKRTSF